MSTFPRRPFLLLSTLIHLVVFLSVSQVSLTSQQPAQAQEAVAVRIIDFTPPEGVPEETPETAKIWSSKATKAHGGAAETIAEQPKSSITASTRPKGEPLALQRTDSTNPPAGLLAPDEQPSPDLSPERPDMIVALARPIRLELEPTVPEEQRTPSMKPRKIENKPPKLDEPAPDQALAKPPTPSGGTSRADEKIEPATGVTERVTVAPAEQAVPSVPEPVASNPESPELARERQQSPLPIGEEGPTITESGKQTHSSISQPTQPSKREPLEPKLAEGIEGKPRSLKERSLRPALIEPALAGDLAPTGGPAPEPEQETPSKPEETGEETPPPQPSSAPPEEVAATAAEESPEPKKLAAPTSPADMPRMRLLLGGEDPNSAQMPKPGEKMLGPEELFPTDIIEKYAAMESGDVDLTDVSDAVSLDTNELKFFSYFAKIKKEIEEQWRYPEMAAMRGQHGKLSVLFVIDQTGKVREIRFLQTSGYQLLDIAAKDAILKADPFPPFPEHLRRERSIIRINARFTYELYGTI